MPTLIVRDFGCISKAELKLSRLTIIIGPQSSGKSLLSKLMYFFTELQTSYQWNEDVSMQTYRGEIERDFIRWFPPSAWGKKRFHIAYLAGSISIEFTRNRVTGDKVRVSISENLAASVERFSQAIKTIAEKESERMNADPLAQYELFSSIRDQEELRVANLCGNDFVRFQLFIPAGRSLFINLERAFAATRENEGLDPITQRFGRMFNSIRSRRTHGSTDHDEIFKYPMPAVGKKLLGGSIEGRKENIFLAAEDGRSLPLSILSSGQQELLPLLMMLHYWGARKEYLIYIEEPEAHLFPTSQSTLAEYLVERLNAAVIEDDISSPCRMVITTHSPYFLSKINNLLKAGQLASMLDEKKVDQINELIDRRFWLGPDSTYAYAIVGSELKPIIDDGLIDADYLDSISTDIVDQFSALLDIQYAD